MRSLKLFIILFVLLGSTRAFAVNLTGNWRGRGVSQTPQNYRECSEVFFRFEETPTQLKVTNGGHVCQDLQSEYAPVVFDKKEGKLLYKNKIAGSYREAGFALEVPEESYRLEAELVEGELRTQKVWEDSQSFLKVFGMLNKSN